MSDLKVYQIISGDLWAGAENQCQQLCGQLAQNEVAVHPVLFNHGELALRLQAMGLPVLIWDENKLSTLDMIKKARVIINGDAPAIFHAHGPKETFVFGAAKIATNSGSRIVRTIHGSSEHKIPIFDVKKQVISRIKNWADNYFVDHFIAVSPGLERTLLNTNYTNKISTIINAIDCEGLSATNNKEVEHYNEARTLRLGMFARLVDVKRHDLAIKAISLISDSINDELDSIELHIFGDGPLTNSLKELSQSLHISKQIVFHGFTAEATAKMRSIDAMLMPSDHEGTPMALLESMALGIPVIGHNVGGIKDILSFTGHGVLVDRQEAEDYADAIMKLCYLLPEFSRNKESAIDKFRQRYDIGTMCAQHIALYERLILQ